MLPVKHKEGWQHPDTIMTVRLPVHVAFLSLVLAMPAAPALSANIANGGDQPVVLKIVENGNESEVLLEAGAQDQLCPSGCFLTLPNGDRIGLSGDENLKIVKGAAVLQ